jgi:hypothetical protein
MVMMGMLSQSFGDWMRLSVVNFEAIDVLEKCVSQLTSAPASISIDVIAAPHPDDTVLPWEDLLQDLLPHGPQFDSTIDEIISTIYAMVHEAQVKVDEPRRRLQWRLQKAKEATKGVERDTAKRAVANAAKTRQGGPF